MFTDFYRTFYYTVLIIAAGISLLYFKKADKPFKWLCALILLTLINELIAKYFAIHFKANGIVYMIFTPVEYFMYAMIYTLLFDDKKWTKILLVSVACLIAVEILMLFLQRENALGDTTNTESVLLVFLSLKFFITIKENPVYENLVEEGVFWFNSAVLFYYSFDILFWGFYNMKFYLLKNPPFIITHINLLICGLLYIIYAASVLLSYNSISKTAKKNEQTFANNLR
jgi:hypothetical protein